MELRVNIPQDYFAVLVKLKVACGREEMFVGFCQNFGACCCANEFIGP
jgi:hypothetical protein